MFKLSKAGRQKLQTCDDDIQLIVNTALSISRVDFGIAEGHRSVELQQEYFRLGKSRVDGIKIKGKHNYSPSRAFDIYGYVNGKTNYEKDTMCYLAGLIIAVSEMLYFSGRIDSRLRWGGNWDKDGVILSDQKFDDMPHFEIYKP
jgi:peptidoglycan L-alanyl-D-glutamate endopeptidase CwlK